MYNSICIRNFIFSLFFPADLKFEQAVYPYGVSIYETYNPGSVVRIWARIEVGPQDYRWELLWEGESQVVGHTPRIFSPQIRTINERTWLVGKFLSLL